MVFHETTIGTTTNICAISDFLQVYINWMNFIVNLMFPLATLLTLNLHIYRALKKLHHPVHNSNSNQHDGRLNVNGKLKSMLSLKRSSQGKRDHEYERTATCDSPTGAEVNNGNLDLPRPSIVGRSVSSGSSAVVVVPMSSAEEEAAERDARYTRASILMVLVFGLCHAPRLVTNTMEMFIDQEHLPPVILFGI